MYSARQHARTCTHMHTHAHAAPPHTHTYTFTCAQTYKHARIQQVAEERVADDNMIVIRGCKTSKAVTLLLRGANDYMLDEMDRSLHDSLCVVKRVLESGSVVPGVFGESPGHMHAHTMGLERV